MRVWKGYDEAVGEEIRHLRLSRNLSLKDLSSEAGLSYQRLSRHERGLARLPVAELIALADALQASPAHLIRAARPELCSSTLEGDPRASAHSVSDEDRELAAKISLIRDTSKRREIISYIERLAEAVLRAQNSEPAQVRLPTAASRCD